MMRVALIGTRLIALLRKPPVAVPIAEAPGHRRVIVRGGQPRSPPATGKVTPVT